MRNILTKTFDLRNSRFYLPIVVLFTIFLLLANVAAQKILPFGKTAMLTIGDFVFPLVYIIDNILTEVYGYAASRRAIWLALMANIVFALILSGAFFLKKINIWHFPLQFDLIFGRVPQIIFASLIAFIIGEFANSYILAKLKIFTAGKYLWLRAIGSLSISQALDTILFACIAFAGVISLRAVLILAICIYSFKIFYEAALTPAIYAFVRFLKQKEGIDAYDYGTNFNPFRFDKI